MSDAVSCSPGRGLKRKAEAAEGSDNGVDGDGAAAAAAAPAAAAAAEPAAWRWRQAQGRRFKGLTEEDGEATWKEPFLFAVLADTQLGALDDNEKWEDDVALCEEAVRRLNALRPKFAIVCGDLVHHVPIMYPDTDPEIRTRQVGGWNVRDGVLARRVDDRD